ncbi:MAG: cobalamin-dependent protein, partial [Eubacteriales bacterium]
MTELFVAINAKYPHTNLAVRLLVAEAKKTDLPCAYIEHTINTGLQTVVSDILSFSPRVVSFSCYIWNINYIIKVAKALKSSQPDMQILLGGPEVSFDAEKVLAENPMIDFIIRGEGEQAHHDFAEYLLGKRKLSDCASLTYWQDEQILSTPIRIGNQFDTAPFPYPDINGLKNRVIYYEASRGCP